MRKLLFLFLILFPISVCADDYYAVEMPDGSVTIVTYYGGSKSSIDDAMRSFGYSNYPITKVNPSELPNESNHNFLKVQGKKVVVDNAKKQAYLDAKAAKEADRDAVLAKMKISKEDFEKLK